MGEVLWVREMSSKHLLNELKVLIWKEKKNSFSVQIPQKDLNWRAVVSEHQQE